MLFMTAKLNTKKLLIILLAVAGIILAACLLFRSPGGQSVQTASNSVTNNDDRVAFLKGYGWDVTASPTESGQVRIPDTPSDVYSRYNALQKKMGYDLTNYAGKTVMRYVYKVNNYPDASAPVYATLLIYKNQVIGGDITDTSAKGRIQTFEMPGNGSGANG